MEQGSRGSSGIREVRPEPEIAYGAGGAGGLEKFGRMDAEIPYGAVGAGGAGGLGKFGQNLRSSIERGD